MLSRILKVYIILLFIKPILLGCKVDFNENQTKEEKKIIDIEEIKQRGKLIAITQKNTTDYFVYKGVPMGFQYELLASFAKYLDVELEIIPENDLSRTFEMLKSGECDIVAAGLNITKNRREYFDFTNPILVSKQVLVQRKPKGWEKMSQKELDKKLIKNILDLKGKTIYIPRKSAFYETLQEINVQLNGNLNVIEISDHSVEQLIYLTSKGNIDYTVCDEHIAKLYKTYYPNIDVSMPLSIPHNLSWAVRKESKKLLSELNKWLTEFKRQELYKLLYVKYYENPRAEEIFKSEYASFNEGRISKYDEIIKKYCARYNIDWRFLAALIFKESRFRNDTVSKKGAFGIMQMVPETAKRYGITDSSSIEEQILAGIKYIKWIDKKLPPEINDKEERMKFILASYNVGIGHILDAYKLAKKYGSQAHIWDNHVEKFLLEKAKPEYYTDSVVKNGICRGLETFRFVKDTWELYKHYRNHIKL